MEATELRLGERVCTWSFLAILVFFTVGFLCADLIPPPAASDSASQIAHFYGSDVDVKRAGLVLLSFGGVLILPFGIAIAAEIRRIEGPGSAMALLQTGAATFTATATVMYMFVLLAITFRPTRDPDLVLLMNDLAWVPFVGMWQPGAMQACAVGLAVLGDDRPDAARVWPRWVGWFSLWYAFSSLIGVLVPFFTSGPFAWNGLFPFYVGAVALFAWWSVIAFFLMRRLRQGAGR